MNPPMFPLVTDADASDRAAAVFADIRETRNSDYVNNVWRVMANDPAQLERTWAEVKAVMAPGAVDALTKEFVYLAVSITNNCEYCIRSHSASARAKGATDEMLAEVHAVIATAAKTNSLVTGLRVPVDAAFLDDHQH